MAEYMAPPPTAVTEYPKTISVVFTRNVTLQSNKQGVELVVLGQANIPTEDKLYFPRKAFSGVIGGVYEVQQLSEQSFNVKGASYKCMFFDKKMVAEWQLAARADDVAASLKTAEKKAKEQPEMLTMMAPLRSLYKKSMPDQRRAIEVLLLDYLRRA